MKKIVTLCLLVFSTHLSANQVFDVKNGSEVTAQVYKSGLSRIYLKDDRISAIKGIAGEFQLDKNDEVGDIYIKPLTTRTSDELDLFIQSERGNNYSLRLSVASDKPESIRLDARDLINDEKPTSLHKAAPKNAEVIELIKIASMGHEIKGYSSVMYGDPSPLRLKRNVVSVMEKSYEGKKYRVEVIRLENNTKDYITIEEQDLADYSNVIAVSIEMKSIAPKEYSKAYRVVGL